jgi:MOSC domain-containing protein YiiM
MFEGEVVAIYIGPDKGEPMQSRDSVQAIADRGLEGDRYFQKSGTFSNDKPGRAVTLIEAEAVEAASKTYDVEIDPSETRRNIVTRGVPLNHLVDKDFTVGNVRLHGVKLCEPCGHLERVTEKGVKAPLIHRGGLRAEILNDGTIGVGDTVRADTG